MEKVIEEFVRTSTGYGFGDGSGFGSGSGYDSGDGYGFGDGDGSGDGYGFGYGFGDGDGYGFGDGSGYGSGSGSGYGFGDVDGDGSGYGDGDGYGFGYGFGDGDGYGSGDGIKQVNGKQVLKIDDIPTLIYRVRGNIAKGAILRDDLTLKPCYIVKQDNLSAHGDTLREAWEALAEKLFEDMPEEERLAAFVAAHQWGEKYPHTDFFDWHNRLTGSCLAGRQDFAERHGVDMDGQSTVEDFIRLTQNAYGGSTIKKLWGYYGKDGEE